MRFCESGGITFTEVVASAHEVISGGAFSIDHAGMAGKLMMVVQLAGTGFVNQRSRVAQLSAGDLAVYDSGMPYRTGFIEDARALVLSVPFDMLDIPGSEVQALLAITLSGKRGVGALAVPMLSQLAANLDLLGGPAGPRLAADVQRLMCTVLAEQLMREDLGAAGSDARFHRVLAWIEGHLADPALTPDDIAGAFFMSTRRLYVLFQDRGTTVAVWVKRRRLAMCARDLRDPTQVAAPVAEIGRRWGFADAAHFSRSFKSEHGCSPVAYREGVHSEELAAVHVPVSVTGTRLEVSPVVSFSAQTPR